MTDAQSLNRVLVANRGEIALRAIRVCRHLGFETVAVYSIADAASPHVWAADRAFCIGPPPAQESYLSIPTIIHLAIEMDCDAIYPGYGFLAENAAFAKQCTENGIKFVGPSAETIRTMGDKAKARKMAAKFGVPVVPGSDDAYVDVKQASEAATDVGYPMLLKARSGGGGRGMRIVEHESEFTSAFVQANREAEAAFGDGAIYMERFFSAVRHIEVQVVGDGLGGAIVFEERDCSVQRRHQKLVEESPSPVVGEELRRRLLEAAEQLTKGIRYEGVGTIEYILDTTVEEFYFIEMNTRIQVEHTITEMRTGLDLIECQFDIAQGKPLPELDKSTMPGGHAIEFRINTEDWRRGFQPSPGNLDIWRPPRGEGIRLDTAAYQGQPISPFYDSMIAKLIVHGDDRVDALEKARGALSGFRCDGVATTIDFYRMLLDHEDYLANRVHTRWIETRLFPTVQGPASA
jgi:acetyl-CoA carboxylase biotin carboxylase subunit